MSDVEADTVDLTTRDTDPEDAGDLSDVAPEGYGAGDTPTEVQTTEEATPGEEPPTLRDLGGGDATRQMTASDLTLLTSGGAGDWIGEETTLAEIPCGMTPPGDTAVEEPTPLACGGSTPDNPTVDLSIPEVTAPGLLQMFPGVANRKLAVAGPSLSKDTMTKSAKRRLNKKLKAAAAAKTSSDLNLGNPIPTNSNGNGAIVTDNTNPNPQGKTPRRRRGKMNKTQGEPSDNPISGNPIPGPSQNPLQFMLPKVGEYPLQEQFEEGELPNSSEFADGVEKRYLDERNRFAVRVGPREIGNPYTTLAYIEERYHVLLKFEYFKADTPPQFYVVIITAGNRTGMGECLVRRMAVQMAAADLLDKFERFDGMTIPPYGLVPGVRINTCVVDNLDALCALMGVGLPEYCKIVPTRPVSLFPPRHLFVCHVGLLIKIGFSDSDLVARNWAAKRMLETLTGEKVEFERVCRGYEIRLQKRFGKKTRATAKGRQALVSDPRPECFSRQDRIEEEEARCQTLFFPPEQILEIKEKLVRFNAETIAYESGEVAEAPTEFQTDKYGVHVKYGAATFRCIYDPTEEGSNIPSHQQLNMSNL